MVGQQTQLSSLIGALSRSRMDDIKHYHPRVFSKMAALQTFDQALADSAPASGKEWSDERLVVIGRLAAKLSDEELVLLRVIWPDRPVTWQKHCAQVLG